MYLDVELSRLSLPGTEQNTSETTVEIEKHQNKNHNFKNLTSYIPELTPEIIISLLSELRDFIAILFEEISKLVMVNHQIKLKKRN